jgi:ABC-type oligopeptide transport system substrate-binding subunit
MNHMRVISMIILVFCLLAGACASQGNKTNKTKISTKYHKKEYPKSQANINSLQYTKRKKTKQKKPGLFKRLFPSKKSYYATQ